MPRNVSVVFIWSLAFITALIDIYFLTPTAEKLSLTSIMSSCPVAIWNSMPFALLAAAEARIGRNVVFKLIAVLGFIWLNSYFLNTDSWKPNSGNSTSSLGLIFGPIYLCILFSIVCIITLFVKRRR
jgi:hypothetical protein